VRRTYGYLRDDHQTGEGNRLIGVLLSSFCLHHSPFLSNADSFRSDLHPDLKADFILANPPFNMSDWGGENLRQDVRWKYGQPPANNANYAWIQHFLHHLSPNGIAGFVMANGSMSTQTSNEGEIRKAIIEADLVDCIVALPGQLFFTTQIPVCLWFLSRNKKARVIPGEDKSQLPNCLRERQNETLFIDARKMGVLIDRIHRELKEEEIYRIADTYHQWKLDLGQLIDEADKRGACLDLAPPYADLPGFCRSVKLEEIRSHDYVLTPGRYVGAAEIEDDGEPFEQKMNRLTATLEEQFAESAKLEKAIRGNLKTFEK
jgi:type I restriction enzyme M protein